MDAALLPSTGTSASRRPIQGAEHRLGARTDTALEAGSGDLRAPGHQLRVQARSGGYVFARTVLPAEEAFQVAVSWASTGCVIEVVAP